MARPFEAYENLKEKLGEEQARAVIEYVDTATKQGLATKDDINRLELTVKDDINRLELTVKDDINRLELTVKDDINRLELTVKDDINRLELKMEVLKRELEGVKTDLIKWMIGTGIGIVALLLSILRFTGKP